VELQSIVDDLAGAIGRAVVINDSELRVLAASAQGEPIDRARVQSILSRRTPDAIKSYAFSLGIVEKNVPVVIPSNPDLGVLRRLCVPLLGEHERYGYLWIILDTHDLTELHQIAVETGAHDAVDAFRRHHAAAATGRARHTTVLLEAVLSARPEDLDNAAADFYQAFPLGADHRLFLHAFRPDDPARAPDDDVKNWIQAVRRQPGGVLVPDVQETFVLTKASGSVHGQLPGEMPGSGGHGISSPFSDIRDVRTAREEARFAAVIAAAIPDFGGTASYADLGGWLLLQRMPWNQQSVRALSPAAAELTLPGREMLLQTVIAFLDNAGDTASTISDLRVHRTTFYYRMEKVRETIGDTLDHGWSRVGLHAALRLHGLVVASENRG
jgi:PucR C-terminal helix-turn-helix domain